MSDDFAHLVTTLARTLHKSLSQDLSKTLDDQLTNLPARYFRSFDLGRIHHDLTLIRALEKSPVIVDAIRADSVTTLRILLKKDQPKVFLRVVGCLARHFIGIERASIFTGLKDPLVLDHFDLTGDVPPGVLERVCAEIRESIVSNTFPEPYLPAAERSGLTITEEQAHSPDCSMVTVVGKNQLGFLYRIAQVFADQKLTLLDAFIRTRGDKAIDSFYIVNETQQKLTLEELDALRQQLNRAFGG